MIINFRKLVPTNLAFVPEDIEKECLMEEAAEALAKEILKRICPSVSISEGPFYKVYEIEFDTMSLDSRPDNYDIR